MQKNDITLSMIRNLFPVFSKPNSCIYFDSASTSQIPQAVLDAMQEYYIDYKANIGRGIYAEAERATERYEEARKVVAHYIGAQSNEIIVTTNTTAALSLVVLSWAQQVIQPGDEIVVSDLEHHSNFVPWQQLCLQKKALLKIVKTKNGIVRPLDLQTIVTNKTKIVSLFHQSNITGTVNPIPLLAPLVHAVGAKLVVDAAQSVAHHDLDVAELGCDFLAFSGHKMFGPTGIGILYARSELMKDMKPVIFGGGMVYSVGFDQTVLKQAPFCFEAGTPPIAELIGLAAAVRLIQSFDRENLRKHETTLSNRLIKALHMYDHIRIVSNIPASEDDFCSIVTFYTDRMHAHDIAAYLAEHRIAVRAGHHCVQPYMESLGVHATVRVSFSVYNTIEEVEYLIDCLHKLLSNNF